MRLNIDIAITPSSSSVVAAFLLLGLRNAGTPLLMASMPVSAVEPRRERTRDQEDQRQAA